MNEATPTNLVAARFDNWKQQRETSTLGMWTLLVSELLFFGSFFLAYAVYRALNPAAFAAASSRTEIWIGTLNTAILLTSSFCMALAVNAAKLGQLRKTSLLLVLTAVLGAGFMGLKGLEYYKDWQNHLVPGVNFQFDNAPANNGGLSLQRQNDRSAFPPQIVVPPGQPSALPDSRSPEMTPTRIAPEALFFVLYFFLTGLHAVHLTVGICWVTVAAILARKERFADAQPVEILGLYWHFVDVVWIFLYPMIYLGGRHI